MSTFLKALQRAEEERLRHEPQHVAEEALSPDFSDGPLPDVDSDYRAHRTARLASTLLNFAPPQSESLALIDRHLVSLLSPAAYAAEQYRALRYMVERARQKTGKLAAVAVSSPSAGDGKTTTAINLAGALAQANEARILLIDADVRRPAITQRLGIDAAGRPGLVDAILNPNLRLPDVVQHYPLFKLWIVPAGRSPATAYELLKAPRFGALLHEARQQYDYIVLDTPPVVPFPDCRLLAQWVDGFFLIVAAHRTSRKALGEALTTIEPGQLLGLAFNRGSQEPVPYEYADTTPHIHQFSRRASVRERLSHLFSVQSQGRRVDDGE